MRPPATGFPAKNRVIPSQPGRSCRSEKRLPQLRQAKGEDENHAASDQNQAEKRRRIGGRETGRAGDEAADDLHAEQRDHHDRIAQEPRAHAGPHGRGRRSRPRCWPWRRAEGRPPEPRALPSVGRPRRQPGGGREDERKRRGATGDHLASAKKQQRPRRHAKQVVGFLHRAGGDV